MSRRPNVVYLHTHDTGRHIEPYGAPVRTPRLQEFAEDGVVFRNAHAVAPTCSPSRAGLLTGRWAHSCGMLGLAHRGQRIDDYARHLVGVLGRAGHTTTLIGVQHEAPGVGGADLIGYDEEVACSSPLAPERRAAAVDFLRRDHDRPFFLSLGLVETHVLPVDGWTFAHPSVDDRWVAPAPTMPDTPATRRDMGSFAAALDEVDQTVGAVVDTLRETGRLDDTVIIVTTDHGIAMPGMKCTLTSAGTGVMLMLRGPGLPEGVVVDELVSHVDVLPTLCELIGLPTPDWTQGHSLLPTLAGRSVREETFAEINFHVSYEPQRVVRTERYSYLRRFDERRTPTLTNVDDSPSRQLWVDAGWAQWPVAQERLHDLVFDPRETDNLVDDPAHADVLADLRRRLDRWMIDTDDPLLRGPLTAPPGFPAQDPDEISPRG